MTYEDLLQLAESEGVIVEEYTFNGNLQALYIDGIIFIDKKADTRTKKCLPAEELGHHHTACGNITDYSSLTSSKQETLGRRWAYAKIITLEDLVQAVLNGCENMAMIAQELDITEGCLTEAIAYFSQKYGHQVQCLGCTVILDGQHMIIDPALDDIG